MGCLTFLMVVPFIPLIWLIAIKLYILIINNEPKIFEYVNILGNFISNFIHNYFVKLDKSGL